MRYVYAHLFWPASCRRIMSSSATGDDKAYHLQGVLARLGNRAVAMGIAERVRVDDTPYDHLMAAWVFDLIGWGRPNSGE